MDQDEKKLPVMRQIQYLTALKLLEGDDARLRQAAQECSAAQGAAGRFFRDCRDNGILTEDYRLTEYGANCLHGLRELLDEMESFLRKTGLSDEEVDGAIRAAAEIIGPNIWKKR